MVHFDPYQENLPIVAVFDEVKSVLSLNNTAVLTAPPGAGKSTLLPLALKDEPWLKGKKILMLEPRRLAAKGIASRMADLCNEKVGESIGYRIRFETRIGENTKIEILTEGILTRMLQNDNALEDVGLIIFDEFHERSIHADTALVLVKEMQGLLREDLRVLVMSATIDTNRLTELLDCPLIESDGKQYPVAVNYETDADERFVSEAAASTILNALKKHEGDVLCFLPGEREIEKCREILSKKIDSQRTVIHTLYGRLPQLKQQAAIRPNTSGKRKVVIATSIAETSLTIEGVTIVVDGGFSRSSRFDPRSGLSGLITERITKDAADQRAGRAGRLSPGVCYRLWSLGTDSKLIPQRRPEILEADLAPLVLNLYNWGNKDIQALQWVDSPPQHAVDRAIKTLIDLEAIENNHITTHGKRMNALPTHPRIAHMLLIAEEEGLTALATDIAALIEERDPLPAEAGIDITLRIEALRRYRKNNTGGGKFGRIERVAAQYRKLMGISEENVVFDPYEAGLLLVHAYPERIAFARPGNNAQFQLSNGAYAMASHKDDLAHEPWLAIANLNDRESGTGKIFLAAPLNPTDLVPFLKEVEILEWNSKKGGLIATKETRIGSIILKSSRLTDVNSEKIKTVISSTLNKEGANLLDFNENVQNWQNRILSLKKWHPEIDLPNVSTEELLNTNAQWLSPYLSDVRKNEDLKKIDLLKVLQYSLNQENQQKIEELAPAIIKVPSGSIIQLQYQANGNPPILAVRLQEIFGLETTPTVNKGEIPVLMHILSPGYKIVQTTSDLSSFWKNAYHEVRKELRIRYKKHAWPENPFDHQPIKGIKKKG